MPDPFAVDLRAVRWLPRLDAVLEPGEPAPEAVDIPESEAERVLGEVVRLVADLPRGSSPEVVWTDGDSELLVHTDRISLSCTSGMATIGLLVDCDQLDGPAEVSVPLAVGTAKVPAGLVMTTFTEVAGPGVVTAVWSSAITAFAWEALLELARHVAANVGTDTRGRPLVPVAIAAAPDRLLVQAIGRHDASRTI